MKTVGLLFLGTVVLVGKALADSETRTLMPTVAVVLSTEAPDVRTVVLHYDLEELSSALSVARAVIEWDVPNLDPEGEYNFEALRITEPWDENATEGSPPSVGDVVDMWSIEPADYARSGGFMKLHVDRLLESWVRGEVPNYGLAIVITRLDGDVSLDDISEIQLSVQYASSGEGVSVRRR